jgi:heterodisulfide reductase subunit B
LYNGEYAMGRPVNLNEYTDRSGAGDTPEQVQERVSHPSIKVPCPICHLMFDKGKHILCSKEGCPAKDSLE